MTRVALQPFKSPVHRAGLPFKLIQPGDPKSLDEARAIAADRQMVENINDQLDRCSGVLGRVAQHDNFPEDRNSRVGEVVLLNNRFGRSQYDAYVKFDAAEPAGAPVEKAQLEHNGNLVLSYELTEDNSVEALLVDRARGKGYFISGTIGGEGKVNRI